MFGFLKSAIDAIPIAYEGGMLAFRCAKKLPIGKTAKLNLHLTLQDVPHPTVTMTTVASSQEDQEGGFLCKGVLTDKQSKKESLLQVFTAMGLPGVNRRRSRRVKYGSRVLSRELPNFRAVSLDISLGGAQLLCDGPVESGRYLNITFDFSDIREQERTIQVKTAWCSQTPDSQGKYRVGVELTRQYAPTHQAWERLYNYVVAIENGDIMHRTMGSAAPPPPSRPSAPAPAPHHQVQPSFPHTPISSPPWPTSPQQNWADFGRQLHSQLPGSNYPG